MPLHFRIRKIIFIIPLGSPIANLIKFLYQKSIKSFWNLFKSYKGETIGRKNFQIFANLLEISWKRRYRYGMKKNQCEPLRPQNWKFYWRTDGKWIVIDSSKTATHLDVVRVPFELHELGAGPGVPHTQHLLGGSANYHGAWNNQQEFFYWKEGTNHSARN